MTNYVIKNTRGTTLATIAEAQRNSTATSLVLHGRAAREYGLERDQNLVYVLENFANSSAPSNGIVGQLWWDTGTSELYVLSVGSPQTWTTVVPPSTGIGFYITAGDGLTGGGFPTNSPLGTTLNVGAGTGITVAADSISLESGVVTAGTYTAATITVDTYGRVTSATSAGVTSIVAGNGLTTGGSGPGAVTIDVNPGDGIQLTGDTVAVDSTVIRTTGNQTLGGIKTFSSQLRAANGTAGAPSLSFSSNTNTGIYRSGTNEIGFSTNGAVRFHIDSSGRLIADNSTYETLVTTDDTLPNKKYVDDAITSAISSSTTMYAGYVNSTATSYHLPAGWSVSHAGTGQYLITHNLGLSNAYQLSVVACYLDGLVNNNMDPVKIEAPTTNSFYVGIVDYGSHNLDRDFFFIAMYNS